MLNSDDPVNPHVVHAFVALQLIGCFSFVIIIILAAICQRRGATRHLTWFSFCLSWVVFCLSYSLLFLAGQQFVHRPSPGICIAQAALVYAAPPLAGSTSVFLVTYLLLVVLSALSMTPNSKMRLSPLTSFILIAMPWIIWTAVFVGSLLYALHHSENVEMSRNGTYCIMVHTALPKMTSIWATAASGILVALEVAIGVLLYRNRDIISGVMQSFVMAIRVAIFSMLAITAIVSSLFYAATSKRGVQFDVLVACVPPFAAIIFGTQRDLLRVCVFWRKYGQDEMSKSWLSSMAFTTVNNTRNTDSESGSREQESSTCQV